MSPDETSADNEPGSPPEWLEAYRGQAEQVVDIYHG